MAEVIAMTIGGDFDLRERMWQCRRAMLAAVSPDDVAAITRKLVEKACEGCKQAIKLVLGYVLGRPGAVPLGLTIEEEPPGPPAEAPAATVSKRVVTAPSPPQPPVLTPEMERFLSQPFSAAELDDARRTAVLGGRPPKANGK
jgi:hypothetical protein